MPPCAEDNTCPVGSQGAVCNTDYLPQKDAICLLGVCDSAADCPNDWFCICFTANDPLGICSGGGLGEPCTSNAECLSESCMIAAPGFPGFCQ